MSSPTLLVMAKAPSVGQVKTRLAADLGSHFDIAADLAAAALIDTLNTCALTQGYPTRRVALAGDLSRAARRDEIEAALIGWEVVPQHGRTFADRLAHAHAQIAGPVVQIGMDTPHLSAPTLDEIALQLTKAEAVLGPATDGGWWVLGWRTGGHGGLLRTVPMSHPETGRATHDALLRAGLTVDYAPAMTDVDHLEDAQIIAEIAPETRFAEAMRFWNLERRAA